MDKLKIRGGHRLNGTIDVAGAKNAALPEEDREFLPIWEACRPYTMTSFARGLAGGGPGGGLNPHGVGAVR